MNIHLSFEIPTVSYIVNFVKHSSKPEARQISAVSNLVLPTVDALS